MKLCTNCQNDLFNIDEDDGVVILTCSDCNEVHLVTDVKEMPDD